MHTEVVLQNEQLLFKRVLSLHSVLMLDGLLPHSHKLPSFEFLEEGKLLDVVVRVSLNEPLTK
jgi:hypothetical protein